MEMPCSMQGFILQEARTWTHGMQQQLCVPLQAVEGGVPKVLGRCAGRIVAPPPLPVKSFSKPLPREEVRPACSLVGRGERVFLPSFLAKFHG